MQALVTTEMFCFSRIGKLCNRPEISFTTYPAPMLTSTLPRSRRNGSWPIEQELIPHQIKPTVELSDTANNASVGGWSVELDTTPTFDSSDLITTSWNNGGFDIINQTYNVSTSRQGETVLESTSNKFNQPNRKLVDSFHFLLPDMTTWLLILTQQQSN